jgi:DNA-binding SARP family transcriptional activator
MKIHEIIQQSYDALLTQAQHNKVLLLHPQSKYRSVLLARMLNETSVNTFYYAMGPDDVNLQAFMNNITHDLANQHPTFGRHLNMLPHEVYDNFNNQVDLILQTFVREITELSSDKLLILIFDEYDRSDEADDIHRFIENLADQMPPNCRVVINSRSLPRLPWVAMIAKRQAALLLDHELITRDFYRNYKGPEYRLEVFALGPGNVLLDNRTVDTWEGHLPRLLFFFALDRPIITRSEICHAFWPDLESDQAVNVFHVTKRRLHKALGIDVLVHTETHYQVNPDVSVYYDVLDFVEILMRARDENNPDRFEDWQKAAKLYRGPFLQGHNEPWIENRRVAFRTGYLEALTEMAQVWISRDRQEQALKLYRQALDEDFTREEIHRGIMKLYNGLGRRSEAVAHYQQMEKTFHDKGLKISPETLTLYNDIMA